MNSLDSVLNYLPDDASDELLSKLTPLGSSDQFDPDSHFVQFYEHDQVLIDSVTEYVSAGLRSGENCVIIATARHRESIARGLRKKGLDVVNDGLGERYYAFDAAETLREFFKDGLFDSEKFEKVIGGILLHASHGGKRVRAFGEMVSLLAASGDYEHAHTLERMWNDLRQRLTFSLFCGYSLNDFSKDTTSAILDLCREHSHVLPAESYNSLTSAEDRLRAIVLLQQKAAALEREIAERTEVENVLRSVTDQLEVQVQDLRGLHEMSVRLTSTLDVQTVLDEVLGAAMSVQDATMGLLSLVDPAGGGLSVKAHAGFDEDFLRCVEYVPVGKGACGMCFGQRQRVIVEDAETDPIFDAYREAANRAGFRAVHSTPLISRRGDAVGVLSVHFAQPHRPSERETRLMDLYARLATDAIENAQLYHRLSQELAERKKLLASEQIARAAAETANRMKDEFLATVSHELRTPLNAIMGWSHMLRGGKLDKKATERAFETIDRNAKAQAQLVEDILDVSRVITGKLQLNMSSVDAASVINAAIDSVQPAANSKDIQIEVTLDPSVRHIVGDANRLQQIVWNLLSNAIKFTPAKGHVNVSLKRKGTDVQLTVADTGQGIEPSFLPFIFDRFRQADASTTRNFGGLGLGLSIVRHLVELHGGSIEAHSEGAAQGATFIVTLPNANVTGQLRPVAGVQLLSPRKLLPQTIILSPASIAGRRLLLLDDDADTLKMLTLVLSESGAIVESATSAKQAIEILDWFKADLVVSDLAMPNEDGYSFIEMVRHRENGQGRSLQAIALTALARVEDRARALSAGFNMFLAKPVEPNELIAAIADLTDSQDYIAS